MFSVFSILLGTGPPHSPWKRRRYTQFRKLSVSKYLAEKLLFNNTNDVLGDILEEINYITHRSPVNEAYAWCRLSNTLVSAIAEEKRFAEYQATTESTANTQSTSSSTLLPPRPSTPRQVAPVNLKFETELKCNVIFNDRPRGLSGVADYTLWYDNNEKMGTNLVVVEAKRLDEASSADQQLFAYMGKSIAANPLFFLTLSRHCSPN